MKRVIDTSEGLGTVERPDGVCEVCAAANANYDEETKQLVVCLNSSLRTTDLRTKEKHFTPDWLPKSEIVIEAMDPHDAIAAAREIFHRWVAKVRQTAPLPNSVPQPQTPPDHDPQIYGRMQHAVR